MDHRYGAPSLQNPEMAFQISENWAGKRRRAELSRCYWICSINLHKMSPQHGNAFSLYWLSWQQHLVLFHILYCALKWMSEGSSIFSMNLQKSQLFGVCQIFAKVTRKLHYLLPYGGHMENLQKIQIILCPKVDEWRLFHLFNEFTQIAAIRDLSNLCKGH